MSKKLYQVRLTSSGAKRRGREDLLGKVLQAEIPDRTTGVTGVVYYEGKRVFDLAAYEGPNPTLELLEPLEPV